MMKHAADRMLEAIARRRAPVCVGLDPVAERLPGELMRGGEVEAIGAFVRRVLDAVAEHVPCVKFQSACFERYGPAGAAGLETMIEEAKARGLEVILDAKRGDIGVSARHYAAAAFGEPTHDDTPKRPDWITASPYLGAETIEPFLMDGRGAFALVRTSNPGGDDLQAQRLEDGRTVAECVADMVAAAGAAHLGDGGYSSLGAVVGATRPADAERLRQRMPQQILLVPGYGAQGGNLDDVLPCFQPDGRGAIVTASRAIIYAFQPGQRDWPAAVGAAAQRFADEIGVAVGLR